MLKLIAATLGLAAFLPTMAQAECAEASQGDLTVSAAWSRATIGTARPAVFYVTIQNNGSTEDRLIGIETPVAGMPMLHETVMSDGVASMPHADQISIAAGETVSLAPGSYHGMLMDLNEALKEGESFPMTLQFQNAGAVTIDTDVVSIREREAPCASAP
ncbi:copper chaperone PCu(A)C [Paracoccus haeundaensis]|uniref:Copper chaperone PCu(A)C n=1 Tax=Paracoccus haeundaensis TaxID=225362 RepID=A0A5C4R143_9RHOB|nr:copper chaperone PCu(A)C [Paracoccus haeundaensis]TNH37690.1 copper chaperone PCu(A)C [Paracoccus haeundaensis]